MLQFFELVLLMLVSFVLPLSAERVDDVFGQPYLLRATDDDQEARILVEADHCFGLPEVLCALTTSPPGGFVVGFRFFLEKCGRGLRPTSYPVGVAPPRS